MIPAVEIRRAEAVVDRSGLVGELEDLLRPRSPSSGRHTGRPRDISVRTFLVGVLLAAGHGKNLHLRRVHHVLTRDIARNQQDRLGVRYRRRTDPGGAFRRVLTYHHLSRITCALAKKVRRDGDEYLQSICDRLIDASVAAGPTPSGDWAIDGTGVDTWANGLKAPQRRADPDAAWGHRTPTPQKSMSKKFYGYDLYGFTALPPAGADGHEHPPLIRRIVVRPAASDDAEASLVGIDDLITSGVPVDRVIVDRGISYKAADRWADELRARRIPHVMDMHAAERGRVDHHGIAMIDGWPHCPAISETLVEITRPEKLSVPRNDQDRSSAAAVAIDEFRAGIAARDRYAFRRTSGWTTKKRSGERVERYECPAEAGQMRCPLKAHSMAYPDDVPAVLNPPDPATAPTCCSQRTVELGEDAQGKLRQEHRWGTDTWIKAYGRRTFVEGGFGVLRNPALGGLSRGLFCIIGRIKVTLWLAALVAATNIAALASWATRTGVDGDDPALAPITDDDWAFEELDPSSTTGTDPPPAATPN